jgi:hypothetical protein
MIGQGIMIEADAQRNQMNCHYQERLPFFQNVFCKFDGQCSLKERIGAWHWHCVIERIAHPFHRKMPLTGK